MEPLNRLARVATEAFSELPGSASRRRLFSGGAAAEPPPIASEPVRLCPGLVCCPPRKEEGREERLAMRVTGFAKLVQEALRNKASMYSAAADSKFGADPSGWWQGCKGFLLRERPSNVSTMPGMLAALSNTSEPPSSGPGAVWLLLFDSDDGVVDSVFRHPTCDRSTTCEHCCGGKSGFRKNFHRSMEKAGCHPLAFHPNVPHRVLLSSPGKTKTLILSLQERVAELKKDTDRMAKLLDARPSGVPLSDDADDLLQSKEVLGYVKKFFGEDSDGAAVWECMMDNARRSAKATPKHPNGSRRGNRYPDVVIRLAVQLLTKMGDRNYTTLAGLFFLPHLRTVQHYRYFLDLEKVSYLMQS